MIISIRNKKKEWTDFLIDDQDFELIMSYKSWSVNNGYLVTQYREQGQKMLKYFHRLLMAPLKIVDHINCNRSDNRRINLRGVTAWQNVLNSKSVCKNKHGYRGVVYIPRDNLFRAVIRDKGKQRCIGHFKTAKEAANAYRTKAKELHGEFAKW